MSLDAYRDKQQRQKAHRPHPSAVSAAEERHRSFTHQPPPSATASASLHPHRPQHHAQPTNHDTNHPAQAVPDFGRQDGVCGSQQDQGPDDPGSFNFGYPPAFDGAGDNSVDSFPFGLDNPDLMPAISPLQFDDDIVGDSQEATQAPPLPPVTSTESNGPSTLLPPVIKAEPRTPPLPVKHRPQTPPLPVKARPQTPPKPRPQTPPPPIKVVQPATPPLPPPVTAVVVKVEPRISSPPPPPPPAPLVKEKEKSSERRERKERHRHKHGSSERSRSKHGSPGANKHGQDKSGSAEGRAHGSDRIPDPTLHQQAMRNAAEAHAAVAASVVPVPTEVAEAPAEERVERNGIGKHDRKSSGSSRSDGSSRRDKSERRERKESSREKNGSSRSSAGGSSGGLKITITKEKLQQSGGSGSTGSPPREALKIKIPKLKIVPPTPSSGLQTPPPPPPSSGLKLKISKERLNSGRKRDRRSGDEGDRRSPKSRKVAGNGANHAVAGAVPVAGPAPTAAPPFVGFVPPQYVPPPYYAAPPFTFAPPPPPPPMHMGGPPGYHQMSQYFNIPPPPPPPPLDPPLPKEPPLPPPPPPSE